MLSFSSNVAVPVRRLGMAVSGILAASVLLCGAVWPDEPALEIPEDLTPETENAPAHLNQELHHHDESGFPESVEGLLVVQEEAGEYLVTVKGDDFPYLLYAQFANRQRDGVFLARNGDIRDPLPSGDLHLIPYGSGALKINAVYFSLVEGLIVPHVSDNQKTYEPFPLKDLYVGGSVGVTGLLFETMYVYGERLALYAATGLNTFGWFDAPWLAPINYYIFPLHLGAGVRFGGLMQRLLGANRCCTGAELLLGLGDGDGDDATPSLILIPGVFFEIEKRDLFGWGSGWDGFSERGDYREDPRPDNYHVRALYVRAALYVDLQTGSESGYVELNTAVGLRYNARGPRIPDHELKETRVVYVNDAYEEQIRAQRERRLERMQNDQEDG